MNWTDEDQVSIYYSMILTLLKHFLEKFPQPKYIWKPLKFTTEIMSNIAIILSRNEYQNIRMHAYSVMSDSLPHHGLYPARLLCPGKNTRVGCHILLQGIFPSQKWNPGLLHCRQILYCLSHQRSPIRI